MNQILEDGSWKSLLHDGSGQGKSMEHGDSAESRREVVGGSEPTVRVRWWSVRGRGEERSWAGSGTRRLWSGKGRGRFGRDVNGGSGPGGRVPLEVVRVWIRIRIAKCTPAENSTLHATMHA